MKNILEWFARHRVAANLLMALIVLGGLLSLGEIRTQVFPGFETDLISITVPYPGAAPEEVETAVCVRLEERVQDLEFVERIRSIASEGVGTVILELLSRTNMGRALDEAKAQVGAIDSFPAETERPIIQQIEPRLQVLSVALSGATDQQTRRRLGERIRNEIPVLPALPKSSSSPAPLYEIAIELTERALRRYGLTFDEVARRPSIFDRSSGRHGEGS